MKAKSFGTGAKISLLILEFLCALIFCGLLLTCFGMGDAGFYRDSSELIRERAMRNYATDTAEMVYVIRSDGCSPDPYLRSTNVYSISLEDPGQEPYIWTFDDSSEPGHEIRIANYQMPNPRHVGTQIDVILKKDLSSVHDDAYWWDFALKHLYPLRFLILIPLALSGIGFLLCFIFLLLGAGHRKTDTELHPGPLARLPFEIPSAIAFIACVGLLAGVFDLFWSIRDIFSCTIGCLFIALGALIFTLWAMDLKVRIGLHTLWSGSLCCMLWKLFKRFCKWVKGLWLMFVDGLKMAYGHLPFFWQIMLGFTAFSILQLVLVLVFGRFYAVILLVELLAALLVSFPSLKALLLLNDGANALAAGDLDHKIDLSAMRGPFRHHGENLNHIADGMSHAVEDRLKSERMKTELITNVSHDLKTPLTSIINYSDLITRDPSDTKKVEEYAQVLNRQSIRLKRLLEDLVEASKASTGNLDIHPEPCEAGILLTQAAGEFEEKIAAAGLSLILSQPDQPIYIMADSRRMWRIFDNLFNNISKYALSGTRVYVSLQKITENAHEQAVFTFKNISREELNVSPEELLERFVRGDSSRNTEGNGLGLSIARSLAELQKGTLSIDTDGDLFKVILSFPLLPLS